MEDAVAQTLAGAVADRYRTVRVVNVFITRRHLSKHQRAQLQSEIANRRFVGLKKFLQRGWRRIAQTTITSIQAAGKETRRCLRSTDYADASSSRNRVQRHNQLEA